MSRKIVIVGGGAAGFFAAIRAAELSAEHNISCSVVIYEASDSVLKKVRISGGGRCNVTHACFDVRKFVSHYPRGSKELIGPMQRFQASDTVEWFRARGVSLVAEEDGRMFPSTNKSETVIECLLGAARAAGVEVVTGAPVLAVSSLAEGGFSVKVRGAREGTASDAAFSGRSENGALGKSAVGDASGTDTSETFADAVMIATGSSQVGYRLARELGHTITELAPSLFSFKIVDKLLAELPGLSFENARVKLILLADAGAADAQADSKRSRKPPTFEEQGPLLITHWGLSGPAVLKISAWSAREMMQADYKGTLRVNWLGLESLEKAHALLRDLKETDSRALVMNACPVGFAKRFWAKFLEVNEVAGDKRWAEVSRSEMNRLGEKLYATDFVIAGKNRYKDEFVECGGVSLKEIDFKTFGSRLLPGLFFAGELLDIDGITGGFNFQNAWTGGWIAGGAMIKDMNS